MKIIILLTLVILLGSCEFKESTLTKPKSSEITEKKSENLVKFDSVTYDYIHLFPTDISIDTIAGFDSTGFLKYYAEWPVFKNTKYNFLSRICKDSAMKNYNRYLKEFQLGENSLDNYVPFEWDNNEIQYFPELIHVDDSIFSICWTTYIYGAGAAHGSGTKNCLTINMNEKRIIRFEDLFAFETKKDSADFQALIESYHADIELEGEIYPYDFFLKDDFIVFVFEDYEVCSYAMGAPKAVFHKKELQRYLKIKL